MDNIDKKIQIVNDNYCFGIHDKSMEIRYHNMDKLPTYYKANPYGLESMLVMLQNNISKRILLNTLMARKILVS
jgi:hypothetical protein